jgi:radical SAM superfamily enzyme YgiQ (UPF0313 family)
VARLRGHHVDVFDLALEVNPPLNLLQAKGIFDSYDVYGFSTYSDTVTNTVALASRIKQQCPDALIVLGGYHASLKDKETLIDFGDIDLIVRKEGELTFAETLDILAESGTLSSDWSNVLGVTWRGPDGKIIRNPDRPVIDQELLPFPVHPEGRFAAGPYITFVDGRSLSLKPTLSMVSSRGCPKRCTFCSIIVINPLWRARSPGSIMSEISYFYKIQAFRHVMFQDANFFVKPSRTLAFAEALYSFNPQITWSATATADNIVKHEDVLRKIGNLNCAYLEVGIESGNNNSLGRFAKGPDAAINQRAIELLDENNIALGLDFIMFEPEMTINDLQQNLSFLMRNELFGRWPADFLFQELRLYPGTVLRDRCADRLQTTFDDHVVPDTPFCDRTVEVVFHISQQYYRRYYRRIADTVKRHLDVVIPLTLDCERQASADALSRKCQNAQALAIRLQHAPYTFVSRLLDNSTGPSEEWRVMAEGGFLMETDQEIESLATAITEIEQLASSAGANLRRRRVKTTVFASA